VIDFQAARNDGMLRENLDLLQETREAVRVKTTEYQRRMARYFESRVRERVFSPGDLVLRRMDASKPLEAAGKLSPNWEGPYRVIESLGKSAYKLATLEGKEIPRTWNAEALRKYLV
jgi:hypothetical protein